MGSQSTRVGKTFTAILANVRSLVGVTSGVDLEMISTGEALVTSSPSALVGLGTSMSSDMSGESTRSGEGSFATIPITFPGLGLGLVGHSVDLQTTRIGKGRVAVWPVTFVVLGTTMKQLVVLESTVALEDGRTSRIVALEWLLARRGLHLTIGSLGTEELISVLVFQTGILGDRSSDALDERLDLVLSLAMEDVLRK